MTTIALVGNPNCGKTTLFNALTGTHQHVGNWPGVTVEKKTGHISVAGGADIEAVDLPGTYSLDPVGNGIDEQIARDYITSGAADVVVNVVDAATLSRGLYLTNELLALGQPMIVALNMVDVAQTQGVAIDHAALADKLGCPVIPIIASKRQGVTELLTSLSQARAGQPISSATNPGEVYQALDQLSDSVATLQAQHRTASQKLDAIVLNRFVAFPIFLAVMYLMFLFSINIGSAFIDWFDLVGSALFVEGPRHLMQAIGLPGWLTTFLADGVGGGVQLVGTFIPVIGAMFLALAFLEDSGYMARVAFIVDRLLRAVGLPGKSFVPLIVGFGCNVPAVMATRALDSEPDRILTTLMAPYMSCGARLTVYALFAAAFFPSNGQNVVFGLYLFGILVAVLSALTVRKHLLPAARSDFVIELPPYHLPIARNIVIQAWQRLKGFVVRAGKAIVLVVICLNVLNSIGTDGSVGNQDSEQSVLSAIGKTITPVFGPMGIEPDNWPATVGIFTGIFAKEVVVGTLDALYAPDEGGDETDLTELIVQAFASVPANLSEIGNQLLDPLGLDLGDLGDVAGQAADQEVQINTISAMQSLFNGQAGAFAYLLFILLYMPCVATIGVIYKEIGSFWAIFSVAWSFVMAYGCAVLAYQVSLLDSSPLSALGWIGFVGGLALLMFYLLIRWGRRQVKYQLIPIKAIE